MLIVRVLACTVCLGFLTFGPLRGAFFGIAPKWTSGTLRNRLK